MNSRIFNIKHIYTKGGALLYLDKKQKIIIYSVSLSIIIGIIIVKYNVNKSPLSLDLNKNQRLIDYTYNDKWLFSIIEDKEIDNTKTYIYIYKGEVSSNKINWHKIAQYDFTEVLPWKIEIGSIDYTDGLQVIMAVNKSTHFDKEQRDRLFVFNWDGEKLYKKWTGSRLGYNLKDFYIMDFLDIKGDELVAIDVNANGEERILVYYWMDFGFLLLAQSEFYSSIKEVKYIDNNILELIYIEKGKKFKSKVSVRNGWLLEAD